MIKNKEGMFNEEQKMQFIRSLPDSNKDDQYATIVNFFKRLNRKVESKFGQDFAEFDYNKAKLAITLLGGRSQSTISWNLSRLRQYLDWCIVNGKTSRTENVLAYVSPEDIDNTYIFRTEMLKSPSHLRQVLDIALPDARLKHPQNITRLIMLLLYDGLTIDEITEVKKDDLDLVNNILKYRDKIAKLQYDEIELINQVLVGEFITVKSKGFSVTRTIRPTDNLIGSVRSNDKNFKKALIAKISNFNRMYQETTGEMIRLSPERVFDSGVFYKWYQIEQSGEAITDDVYSTYFEGRTFESEYFRNIETKRLKQHYSTWKKAFEL